MSENVRVYVGLTNNIHIFNILIFNIHITKIKIIFNKFLKIEGKINE